MSVYVDNTKPTVKSKRWRYSEACHLMADDIMELLEFASRLGLAERWMQVNKDGVYYFNLNGPMRRAAIRCNAKQISNAAMERLMREQHRRLYS